MNNNNNSNESFIKRDEEKAQQKIRAIEFSKDLVNLLNDVVNPTKDREISYLKGRSADYMYASLGSCLSRAKEHLAKHNFALSQVVVQVEGKSYLQTKLIHVSGKAHCDGGVPLVSKDNSDPQKLGSAITYAKRYGLCAILGIDADVDDDGVIATPNIENLNIQKR